MSDDYQSIPVAEARAAVQSSGLLEGVEGPLFLADNESEWLPYYIGRYDPEAMPLMAKIIVTRAGQKPREVVISWDEYAAELEQTDPAWLEKRKQKPMAIFGAEVERHGYRVVFADILGALIAPRRSENDPPSAESWATADSAPERDWRAEVGSATAQTLNALYDEARDAGALLKIEGLQQAFTDRLLALSSAPKPTPAPTPRPADAAPKRPRNRGRGKR